MHNLFKSLPYYKKIKPNLDVYPRVTLTQGTLTPEQENRFKAVKEGTHLFVDGIANLMVVMCAVSRKEYLI